MIFIEIRMMLSQNTSVRVFRRERSGEREMCFIITNGILSENVFKMLHH